MRRAASKPSDQGNLEVAKARGEARCPRRLPGLDIGQTPPSAARTQPDGCRKHTATLPAPNAVRGNAEAVGDLSNGKKDGLSHDEVPSADGVVSECLRYSGSRDGTAWVFWQTNKIVGGIEGGKNSIFAKKANDFNKVWRRLRDSNPGRARTLAGFQDRCNRPLCQASDLRLILCPRHRVKPVHALAKTVRFARGGLSNAGLRR